MFVDLKVIDVSTVLAGPSVGTFFAELGARVIKVENSKVPDVTRSWKLPTESSDSNVSAYFSSVNFKKEYLQLDLSDKNDHSVFIDLIRDADILISNFKLGDDEKLNVQDSYLRSFNPRLICGKINGYGTESDRVAYDLILQAEVGIMHMNGTAQSGPVKVPLAITDILAGHQLKQGLLLALMRRKDTGIGETVSVSLYDAGISALTNQASNYLMTEKMPERIGSLHPNIAPYGEVFTTQDGSTITFAIGSDKHFRKLCAFLQIEGIANDERFSTNKQRVIHRNELYFILEKEILKHTFKHIDEHMRIVKVPMGKIKNMKEVFDDQQAQQMIREEIIENVLTKRVSSIAFQWK